MFKTCCGIKLIILLSVTAQLEAKRHAIAKQCLVYNFEKDEDTLLFNVTHLEFLLDKYVDVIYDKWHIFNINNQIEKPNFNIGNVGITPHKPEPPRVFSYGVSTSKIKVVHGGVFQFNLYKQSKNSLFFNDIAYITVVLLDPQTLTSLNLTLLINDQNEGWSQPSLKIKTPFEMVSKIHLFGHFSESIYFFVDAFRYYAFDSKSDACEFYDLPKYNFVRTGEINTNTKLPVETYLKRNQTGKSVLTATEIKQGMKKNNKKDIASLIQSNYDWNYTHSDAFDFHNQSNNPLKANKDASNFTSNNYQNKFGLILPNNQEEISNVSVRRSFRDPNTNNGTELNLVGQHYDDWNYTHSDALDMFNQSGNQIVVKENVAINSINKDKINLILSDRNQSKISDFLASELSHRFQNMRKEEYDSFNQSYGDWNETLSDAFDIYNQSSYQPILKEDTPNNFNYDNKTNEKKNSNVVLPEYFRAEFSQDFSEMNEKDYASLNQSNENWNHTLNDVLDIYDKPGTKFILEGDTTKKYVPNVTENDLHNKSKNQVIINKYAETDLSSNITNNSDINGSKLQLRKIGDLTVPQLSHHREKIKRINNVQQWLIFRKFVGVLIILPLLTLFTGVIFYILGQWEGQDLVARQVCCLCGMMVRRRVKSDKKPSKPGKHLFDCSKKPKRKKKSTSKSGKKHAIHESFDPKERSYTSKTPMILQSRDTPQPGKVAKCQGLSPC